MLRNLDLRPVYDSADCNLVRDLIVPLLAESTEYWRGVGYFTSAWLKVAAAGLMDLVSNEGKARVITSPLLEEQDWQAICSGEEAKSDVALRNALQQQVQDLGVALTEDTKNALAWMVADGVLEFRFAVPLRTIPVGDYHDKVAVFNDSAGDTVAIHGSFNDSRKGTFNGEAFSVFKSWEDGQRPYVLQHTQRLQTLWQSGNRQFRTMKMPEAVREEIIRMRSGPRPYALNDTMPQEDASAIQEDPGKISLRPYQAEAIQAWKSADCSGILEMATGTGKTFVSLAAATDRQQAIGSLCLVVLVPYLHLLEQWREHCIRFGFIPILCSGDHDGWVREVRSKVQDFSFGALKNMCVLAVHNTASSSRFEEALAGLRPEHTMLIADEVHALGAPRMRKALLRNAAMRMGLSATPHRWFDDEGTQALIDYFGGVCFEYPLKDAIGIFLTPYRYMPVLTFLTDMESEQYEVLSAQIASLAAKDSSERSPEDDQLLKNLFLRRARLVAAAESKIPQLKDLLAKQAAEWQASGGELRGVVVFCADGTHREVLQEIAGIGLRCHEFVHGVPPRQRESVLRQFAEGDIQVLVAMHCLDEGVDLPSTRSAFLLGSTTNPREFVQRRGRILRLAADKRRAEVYDFVVVPRDEHLHLRRPCDPSLLRREMPRFAEFADAAANEFEARAVMRPILDRYGMLDLLDKKPWDIYRSAVGALEVLE